MPKDSLPKHQKIEPSVISAPVSTSSAASAQTSVTPVSSVPKTHQPISLLNLPDDVLAPNETGESSIGNFLEGKDLCNFTQALYKTPTYGLFQQHIKKKKLLTYIVNADLPAAEDLIKKDPGLLLEEGEVTQKIDDREFIYKGTALTIALELGDVSIYPDHHEEMAEMICRHLRTLPNGEAEIARQIQKYFPRGFVEVKPYSFNAICTAIINGSDADVKAALTTPKNNTTTLDQALNQFRTEFATCPRNICHIAAAFTVYDTQFDNFKTWKQRDLFCIQVIGFVQRYLPLCDLYTFKQGFYNIVENKQRLIRDGFEFKDWTTPGSNGPQKIKVFSAAGVHRGLGFDYCCGVCGVGGHGVGWVRGLWWVCVAKLMSNKNRVLGELYTRAAEATNPGSSKALPAALTP